MRQEDKEYLIRLVTGGFHKKKLFRKEFLYYVKTGEDLFEFLDEVQQTRKFGQTIKKAVLNWIHSNDIEYVKKELCKSYKLFDGLTILRLFHPKPINKAYDRVFSEIKRHCLDNRKK